MRNKWTSRKFWMAVVTIAITLALGLGYQVDVEKLAPIIGAEGALWIIIEGLVDMRNKGK